MTLLQPTLIPQKLKQLSSRYARRVTFLRISASCLESPSGIGFFDFIIFPVGLPFESRPGL